MMEESRIQIIKEDEIKEAYTHQKNLLDWTFFNEREFIETRFSNRFNLLVIIFSLFATAYFMVDNNIDKLTILLIAFLIILLLCGSLFRVYERYKILIRIIHSIDSKSAPSIVFKEFKGKKMALFPNTSVVMIIISIVMLLSLVVWGIMTILNLCK